MMPHRALALTLTLLLAFTVLPPIATARASTTTQRTFLPYAARAATGAPPQPTATPTPAPTSQRTPTPAPTQSPSPRLASLPRHFGVGLSAHPDSSGLYGWMGASGVLWDYAYQYLAGGVNTGNGWQSWNANAQFPLLYARGAAQAGAIPVFPYYMLLQSTGPCDGCGEAERDLANLNDAAVMAAYYRDFAKLMQRLGPGTYDGVAGYGRTAIVHVEPDLSGYAMQAVLDAPSCYARCTGSGSVPALLRAAVARSGVPELAGYPDTYQGFSWALAHLRDLYAPNVLLAFHVSDWATRVDVGSDTRPSIDAVALGAQAGAFAAASGTVTTPAGVTPYDLVFNDVADRDAGYYKYVLGRDVFWDRLNARFPNFARWEQYVAAVRAASGRPVLVWQIPLGNQYFRSSNNTNGHYQDNRAEYFFGHVDELARAGVIGLLFGAGNAGSTTDTDDRADGVTNPAPLCTSDGLSTGQICPDHVSAVSDDDGGYLRQAAAAYFATPYPLTP